MFECKAVTSEFFDTAPHRYMTERELNTTPEKLFDIFEDENAWPLWVGGMDKVEWTSPRPFGVGTTRTVTLQGGLEVQESFLAWHRGKRMAFCFTGTSKKVWWAFAENYEVTDLGEGRCVLRWTVAFEPRGIYKPIMAVAGFGMKLWLRMVGKDLARYVDSKAS